MTLRVSYSTRSDGCKTLMALKDLLVYVDQTENSSVAFAAGRRSRHPSRQPLDGTLRARMEPRPNWIGARRQSLGWFSRRHCKILTSAPGHRSMPSRRPPGCDPGQANTRPRRARRSAAPRRRGRALSLRNTRATPTSVFSVCDEPEGSRFHQLLVFRAAFIRHRPAGSIRSRPSGHSTTLGRHIVGGLELQPARGAIAQRRAAFDRTRRADDDRHDQSVGLHRDPPRPARRADGRTSQAAWRDSQTPCGSKMFRAAPSPTGCNPKRRRCGADLIVAGAFGHPRLWEKMLGGVTHDLIARMSLPVFMSH